MDLGIDTVRYFRPDLIEKVRTPVTTNTSAGIGDSYALTPDYLSFRNTWFGQPQPVSYKFIWKAYLEDPIVRGCIDITVDAIIGDGWNLKGENETHIKDVLAVFKRTQFQRFLQDTVTSLLIYGDSYAELIRANGGLLQNCIPVDSATVRIDYNEHGDPMKYIQRVLHRRVDFYPDEMLHLSINNVGGRVYGISNLQSVIFTVQAKMMAQQYNTEYFRRPGLPRSIYMVKNLSKEQVDRMAANLRQATPQTDLLINAQQGDITHTQVSPSNQDMQFVELMNFLRQETIAATGVPPVFLGITEGSNRSSSQTQMEAWDRRKKKLRLVIEDLFNSYLLTTSNFGFDDVQFQFNDENSRERLKYAQIAQLLSTIPYVTPNQILNEIGFPEMDSDEMVYDSTTRQINKKEKTDGDRPVYELKAEQEKQMMAQSGMGGGNPKISGDANPNRSQTKADNAERLNTAQANETRSKMSKADPKKDYPYGAVPAELEVLDGNAWKQMEARINQIMQVQQQVKNNENPELDQSENPKKPAPKKQSPAKKLTPDKAVFYAGKTQLDE